MAEFFIDVGKIKLTWKDLWSSATDYVVDDLVRYDDGSTISSYVAVADSTNQVPSTTGTVNTGYWNLFASGGLAGGLQPGGTATNQVQYKDGLALGGEVGFTYDPSTDLLTVPSITVSGTAATYDVDVTGTVRATAYYEGANQLTYNISGAQITSGTVGNSYLPADISVTNLTASDGLNVKSGGLIFDNSSDRVGIGTAVPGTALDVKTSSSAADAVVARFRCDHTDASATYIEVQPNSAQAQKSGIHLHKDSLRTNPFSIINDGGQVTIANTSTSAPTIDISLNATSVLNLTSTIGILNNPLRINGCFDEAVTAAVISATNVLTIDATSASVFTIDFDKNITTYNITLPSASRAVSLTFLFTNTDGNQYTVSWPANTKWAGGTDPTMTSTQNYVDIITLSTVDGGSSWYGFVGGSEFQ
tara:strand:+ start:2625 stop:3881 length:1257 start_codon:yes stop_codon:yes gene_type:complete